MYVIINCEESIIAHVLPRLHHMHWGEAQGLGGPQV